MSTSDPKKPSRALGARAYAAMAAVEGLSLNKSSRDRLAALKAAKLTAAQRRQAVLNAYTAPTQKK